MGADLLLCYTPMPVNSDGVLAYGPEYHGQIRRRIEMAPPALLAGAARCAGLDGFSEDWLDGVQFDPDTDNVSDSMLARFTADWLVAQLNLDNDDPDKRLDLFRNPHIRSVNEFRIEGTWYLFCGGTSYGDTPSEWWDVVVVLGQLGIFEEPLEDV